MKDFFTKNKGKLVLALILFIIGLFALSLAVKPQTYYFTEKTVDTVYTENGNAYFTFEDDALTYIAYERNGVDFNKLNALQKGDVVRLNLKETSSHPTYTIIYIMEKGSEVVFDVTDFYASNHVVTSTVFTSIPLLLAASVVIYTAWKKYRKQNSVKEFTVNMTYEWGLLLFLLSFIAGVAFALEFLLFYLLGIISFGDLGFCIVGLLFIALGGFGLIVYYRERITLKNGEYGFRTLIKTYRVRQEDISKISVLIGIPQKLFVLDKNANVLFGVDCDMRLFQNEYFAGSLNENDIKVEYVTQTQALVKGKAKSSAKVDERRVRANSLFNDKNYVAAYELFEEILQEGEDPQIIHSVMMSALYSGKHDRADELFGILQKNKDSFARFPNGLKPYFVEYDYAFGLADNDRAAEAKPHLNTFIELIESAPVKDSTHLYLRGVPTYEMILGLINKIYTIDDEDKKYFLDRLKRLNIT